MANNHFTSLHFLARDKTEVSRVFAWKGLDKVAEVDHRIEDNGGPIIAGVLRRGGMPARRDLPRRRHAIIVGQVEKTHIHGGEPLLYHRGAYATLEGERLAA